MAAGVITLPTIIQKVLLDTKGFDSGLKKLNAGLIGAGRNTQRAVRETDDLDSELRKTRRSSDDLGISFGRTSSQARSLATLFSTARTQARALRVETDRLGGRAVTVPKVTGVDTSRADVVPDVTRRRTGRTDRDLDITRRATDALGDSLEHVGRHGSGVLDLLGGKMFKLGGIAGFLAANIKLFKWPVLIAGASLAVQAIGALGGAFTALVSSMGPAVGILGALPGLFAALLGGIGATVIGFQGVGEAVKAGMDVEKAAASTSAKASKDRAEAAQAVKDAVRQVADAEEDGARAVSNASERVRSAKLRLAETQKAAKLAQEALTQARKDASEQLEDMQFAAQRGVLGERRAILALAQARQALNRVSNDPEATNLDRESALLDVAEAEIAIKEAQDRRVDTQTALNEGVEKGIEGSDRVADAKDRIIDAERALIDAQRESTEATVDLARAQRDSARSVEDAQRKLAEALQANTDLLAGGADKVEKYAAAMAGLSPTAQAFVRALVGMKEPIENLKKAASEGLFPGLHEGLNAVVPMFPLFEGMLRRLGGAVGGVVGDFGRLVATPVFSGKLDQIATDSAENIGLMGDAMLPLASAMANITVAAQPLVRWLLQLAGGWARSLEAMTSGEAGLVRMRNFFDSTRAALTRWGHIVRDFGMGLFNIFKAAAPLGDQLSGGMERVAASFRAMTGEAGNQNKMRAWFLAQRPVITEMVWLVRDLAKGLFGLMNPSGANTLQPFLESVRTKLLPDILNMFRRFDQIFTPRFTELLAEVVRLFSNLIGTSAALMGYVMVLKAMFSTLNWLLQNLPGLREGLLALTVFAGASAAFGLARWATGFTLLKKSIHGTSGLLGGIGNAFGKLSKDGQAATGFMARMGERLAGPFAAAWKAAGLAAAGAGGGFRGAAAGMQAFTVALLANPVVRLVAAIGLLTGAAIALYKNIKPLRDAVDWLWQGFQRLDGVLKVGIFAGVAGGALLAASSFDRLALSVLRLIPGFGSLSTMGPRVGGALAALGKFGLVAGGITAGGYALGFLRNKMDEMSRGKANIDAVTLALLDFSKSGEGISNLADLGRTDLGKIGKAFDDLEPKVEKSKGVFDRIKLAFDSTLRSINLGAFTPKAATDFARSLDPAGAALARLRGQMEDWDKALVALVKSGNMEAAKNAVALLAIELNKTPEQVALGLDDYARALKDAELAAALAAGAINKQGQESEEAARKADLHRSRLESTIAAQERLAGVQLGVGDAEDRVADSRDRITEAQAGLNAAIKEHGRGSRQALSAQRDLEAAQRDEIRAVDDLARARRDATVAQSEANGKAVDATTAYSLYRNELIKLKDETDPKSALYQNLVRIINTLPPKEHTSKMVFDTVEAEAKLNALLSLTDKIKKDAENVLTSGAVPVGTAPALAPAVAAILAGTTPTSRTVRSRGSLAKGGQVPNYGVGDVLASSYRNAPAAEVGPGFVTGVPRAIVGEGSRFPEFVVPTDPAYRERATALFEQLGRRLGAFAAGGRLPAYATGSPWEDWATQNARKPTKAPLTITEMVMAAWRNRKVKPYEMSALGGASGTSSFAPTEALSGNRIAHWLSNNFTDRDNPKTPENFPIGTPAAYSEPFPITNTQPFVPSSADLGVDESVIADLTRRIQSAVASSNTTNPADLERAIAKAIEQTQVSQSSSSSGPLIGELHNHVEMNPDLLAGALGWKLR